jgi:TonB-linked SusC/RagA family outer membrane protein
MSKFYLSLCRYLMVLLMLVSLTATAQNRTVKGKVTSGDDGSAVPGVNIQVKGSGAGTVTDADGNYAIDVNSGSVLVFSFVGYASQEIAVGNQSVIDVVLQSDVTALSEVVVVGYGQQEKKDVTGVVASVNNEAFNKGAIVSPDQLIVGKVAGVQITSNGGEPGGGSSIRIRGGTSFNNSGNEPLYVIDGVPVDNNGTQAGRNPLNFINPNDIESFTVLKDASAAAIYGSRAANGVIIITTKKGKAGGISVTYDGWYSSSQIAKKLDVFNADQFMEVMSMKAPGRINLLGYQVPSLDSPPTDTLFASTNWQNKIYRTAPGRSHAITFSGGNENTTFRMSLNDMEQEGIIRTASTRRTGISLSVNSKLLNNSLTIDANIKGAQTNDRFNPGVIGSAMSFAPTQPVRDIGGTYGTYYGGYWEWSQNLGTKNPVAELELVRDRARTNRVLGNVQIDYKIPVVEGLRANLNLGYDILNGYRKTFRPNNLRSEVSDITQDPRGTIYNEMPNKLNKLLEFYMAYNGAVSSLDLKYDVLAGYSWQDFSAEYPSFNADSLSTNIYGYNNPEVASFYRANNSIQENRLISFFGRGNVSWKDRYLLTLTLRRDGSSRFGPESKWGMFPSAAFAWRVLDESFAAPLQGIFSDLKLRIGYGVTGQQEGIGNYGYLPTYTQSNLLGQVQFGSEYFATIRPNGYDDFLQWEETASFNIGADFGVLDGRLSGSIEYYNKKTTDLLAEVTVPAGSNLTNRITTNVGGMRNSGVELSLDGVVISRNDLSWNLGFNVAFNRNKVEDVPGDYQVGGISGGVGNNIQIIREGEVFRAFYVYKHKTGSNGKPLQDGVDHNADGVINLADMYEDTNDDGVVNDRDLRPYKQPAPKVLMGLTSSLRYKQFDLFFTVRANLGGYVYNNVASSTAYYNRVITEIVPQNMLTSVVKTNFNTPQFFSDYYVENASFLRMDNITLGYNYNKLPGNGRARIYATVQNPFIITDYSGLDPEVQDGIDNNVFPRSRTFIFGVSLSF